VIRFEGHRMTEARDAKFAVVKAKVFRPQIAVRDAMLVHTGHETGHSFREAEKPDEVQRGLIGQRRRVAVPIDAFNPVQQLCDTRAALKSVCGRHWADIVRGSPGRSAYFANTNAGE